MKPSTDLMLVTVLSTFVFLLPGQVLAAPDLAPSGAPLDQKRMGGDVSPAPAPDAPADNTKKNVRDRDDATLTPPDQAQGTPKDVDTTRLIRKSLVKDKSLSTNAKNVKIVTLNGRVTLRGPVNNDAEKKRVLTKAQKVAGPKNVKSELEIARP